MFLSYDLRSKHQEDKFLRKPQLNFLKGFSKKIEDGKDYVKSGNQSIFLYLGCLTLVWWAYSSGDSRIRWVVRLGQLY